MPGEVGARRINVHCQHAAAGRFQQLHRELTQQPQANHSDHVAEFGLGGTYAMESHRTQRCESGFVKRDFVAADWARGNTCQ